MNCIRNWLLKTIAGDMMVVINADMQATTEGAFFGGANNSFMCNCNWGNVRVTQWPHPDEYHLTMNNVETSAKETK